MFEIIEELRAVLPPVFLGRHIDDLTGGAIHWPTIQNRRALRQIPAECFCYTGRQVLVKRDPFLTWWAGTLSETNPGFAGKPPSRSCSL